MLQVGWATSQMVSRDDYIIIDVPLVTRRRVGGEIDDDPKIGY
jgi:hypothetical protein